MTGSRYKDFGSGTAKVDAKPLTFRLYGEEFVARPNLPGRVLLDMGIEAGSKDSAVSAGVILSFFQKALEPESWTRFDALTKSVDKIVTMETLGEITGWLVEEYSGRPEELPGN